MGRHAHTIAQFYLACDPRGNWNVQWQCPKEGKVKRRGCGTKDEAEARAKMPAIVASITNPAPPAAYTVGELIDAYVVVRTAAGKAFSPTFRYNLTHIRLFFGSYRPSQLNDAAYDAYRAYRTSQVVSHASAKFAKAPKPVSDSTAVRDLSALAGAVIWGRKNGWGGLTDVSVSRKGHVRNTRHRYLSRAEFQSLLTVLKDTPHLELYVLLALATGARMSAILELTWDRISWPERRGEYRILDGENGVYLVRGVIAAVDNIQDRVLPEPLQIDLGQGRGNKRRGTGVVGIKNTRLYLALQKAYEAQESFRQGAGTDTFEKVECPHVIHFRGKGIKSIDLTNAYARAGISGANVHTLKHTCCTWLVQAGVSYERVAKLIGTTARVIEQHYGHWSVEHMTAVGDVLNV